MGRSRTTKYRIEMDGSHFCWHGRANDKALEKYVFDYADSLKLGGVNEHISKSLGYIPFPHKARIVDQSTGEVKAEWEAGMFQVF